jgi:hypothetical protein
MTSTTDLEKLIKDLQRRIKLIRSKLKDNSSLEKNQRLSQLLLCTKKQITTIMDQIFHLKAIDCNEATYHHKSRL